MLCLRKSPRYLSVVTSLTAILFLCNAPVGRAKKHAIFNCTTETGTYSDPYSCEAYWICSNGNAMAATCSFGLIYSHRTKNCDWAKPEICTLINGEVVRDWAPATVPPSAADIKRDQEIIQIDKGYNTPMKIGFMTFKSGQEDDPDNQVTQQVDIRFNLTRKGTPMTVFQQYQLLIAKWKRNQKRLTALGFTTTVASATTTREPPLLGPTDYVLPDSVTMKPKKTYTVKPLGDAPISRNDKRCRLPDCYNDASNIPGNLSAEVTPQIIMLTFDDAVNGGNIDVIEKLFSPSRMNPNGCPVTGTFFLANPWTDYKLVRNLSQKGHEIASHSLTHQDFSRYDGKQWRNEIVGEVELAESLAGVSKSEIVGMRAPFLAIGGDVMFRMLWENGFLYDSSIPSSQTSPALWPYTLDSPMPHPCFQEPCPKGYYPGLWEVPLTYFIGMNNLGCSMYDACTFPSYPDEISDLIWTNFKKHYGSNRAPFLLSSHSAWYLNSAQRVEGMRMFMDRALKLGDVYFVSVKQTLQWMQRPTSLDKLETLQAWKCDKLPKNIPPLSSAGSATTAATVVVKPTAPAVASKPSVPGKALSAATVTTPVTPRLAPLSSPSQPVPSPAVSAVTAASVTQITTQSTSLPANSSPAINVISSKRRRRRRSTRPTTTGVPVTTTTSAVPDGSQEESAE